MAASAYRSPSRSGRAKGPETARPNAEPRHGAGGFAEAHADRSAPVLIVGVESPKRPWYYSAASKSATRMVLSSPAVA